VLRYFRYHLETAVGQSRLALEFSLPMEFASILEYLKIRLEKRGVQASLSVVESSATKGIPHCFRFRSGLETPKH
jgi:hypothetical protein